MRSQFDALLLQHAAESGAQVFTQTRVDALEFVAHEDEGEHDAPSANSNANAKGSRSRASSVGSGLFESVGRPVSATYTREDGTKGEIAFDYLVDASGRAGLMSTKCASFLFISLHDK